MNILWTFIILSIINVIFSTIRVITTIKSGKVVASLISGGYFAFYNIMLIYTVMDFPMWEKCVITFVCNVVGVFIVKIVEEKMQKDKLWKLEMTVKNDNLIASDMHEVLNNANIPNNYVNAGHYAIFNCFCATKADTDKALAIGAQYGAKTFASETKLAR